MVTAQRVYSSAGSAHMPPRQGDVLPCREDEKEMGTSKPSDGPNRGGYDLPPFFDLQYARMRTGRFSKNGLEDEMRDGISDYVSEGLGALSWQAGGWAEPPKPPASCTKLS